MAENIEDAVCKHCNKVIRTVPKHYCPRSPNQMHEPVEATETGTAASILAAVDQMKEPPEPSEFIDLTPRGMTTPEGNQRVNETRDVFSNATAEVANKATELLRELLEQVQIPNAFAEDLEELTVAIKHRKAAQEAFFRAVAGAPPPPAPLSHQEQLRQGRRAYHAKRAAESKAHDR